jgi:hypothetical protein
MPAAPEPFRVEPRALFASPWEVQGIKPRHRCVNALFSACTFSHTFSAGFARFARFLLANSTASLVARVRPESPNTYGVDSLRKRISLAMSPSVS